MLFIFLLTGYFLHSETVPDLYELPLCLENNGISSSELQ